MRVIPARGVCSFVKRGNDQVRRIRIILFSVKLRVLNPNLFLKAPHKTNKRDKKKTHPHHRRTHIIKNVCLFLRASGRFATQEGTRFHVVVSSFGFGRRVVVGVRWMMMGFFFFSVCCSVSRLFIIIIIFRRRRRRRLLVGIERNYILFSFRDSIRLSSSRVR